MHNGKSAAMLVYTHSKTSVLSLKQGLTALPSPTCYPLGLLVLCDAAFSRPRPAVLGLYFGDA